MRFSQIFTLQTGSIFLFTFGSIWTFLEFGERYQVIELHAPNVVIGFGALGVSFLIALANVYLSEKNQQNRQIYTLWKQMKARSKALRHTHEALMAEKSYFKPLQILQ